MSASDKKKLRKEAAAAALTEKQKQEQAEAKKLKAITVSFVAVMLVVVLTATGILAFRAVNNSGIIDRNTIAAVTGTHELDSIQMNYYFVDYVRNYYQQFQNDYGTSASMYLSFMGLNPNAPLNEQNTSSDGKETWAEYFLKGALEKAKNDYALYDKAIAEGFKLSEDDQKALESSSAMWQLYAMYSGYKSSDKYLKAIYGPGASEKTYNTYAEVTAIATAYYNQYSESLTYNDAAIREHEKENFNDYSSFSYAIYTVNVSDYLTGGTKAEDGTTTYSDDEKAAAQKKAEEIANQLKTSANLEELNKAIAALEINKDNQNASSTSNKLVMYSDIPVAHQDWMASKDRKNGDITVITEQTATTDAEGKETKTVKGYSVILFQERNDNTEHLSNVRHILVKFEGGTTDESGNKVYSDTEKATAKAEAERLLQEWKDGKATEETFIEMVKKHSDDTGSASDGGLIEDIHRESLLVDSFLNWSVDSARKPGDTAVIVSEYGYHVMYYSSDDTLTYRDYMITEDLRAADLEEWHTAIVEPVTITRGDTKRLLLDLVMANIIG